MTKIRVPRTNEQATELLDRYAALDTEIALIEANRRTQLAATNAVADALVGPVIEMRDHVNAVLREWWLSSGHALTSGKRKSIELGGCMIGSRAGRSSLGFAGDDDAALAALQAVRWAKPYVRVRYSVDKAATQKALTGPHKAKLETLGFSVRPGEEAFFVERVDQSGTIAVTA